MKFLVDRCAGRRLAEWLHSEGHDVLYSPELGPDPGDEALLAVATQQNRVLVTIDADFGKLVFSKAQPHSGIIRLPDVPADQRITLMRQVLVRFPEELEARAIVTVRGDRIRVSRP